jgi:hypothetical protein
MAMVMLAYWPGLSGGFAFDDIPNISENPALRVDFASGWQAWLAAMFSSPASELHRPLAMLTFGLNHALTGFDPWWMKFTNLIIHLLNTSLVFALCRRLLRLSLRDPTARPDLTALWIASAWALNPINVTAVLLVVQRMEILSHVAVVGGLWLYVRGRERMLAGDRRGSLLLLTMPAATAVGVLAKESAVLLPVYALALEWLFFGFRTRDGRARDGRIATFFVCLVAVPAAVGLHWLLPRVFAPLAYAGRNFTVGERLLTEGRVVVDYLHWTMLPNLSQLSLYHDDYPVSRGWLSPSATLPSLLLIGLIAGAVPLLRGRRPLMALGLCWFLLAHLLTATIIPLELVFEHRNYFASLGLCMAMGDAVFAMPATDAGRRAGAGAALLLLLFYAGNTALRVTEWRNPLEFAVTEAAKHPQSPRATYSLARELVIRTGFRADSPFVPAARRALAQAMRAPDATPLPVAAAILFESRLRQPVPSAYWTSLEGKLRTGPLGPQATSALASLVDCQLRHLCDLPHDAMVGCFLAALARGPNPEVLNIYGNYALNVLQDPALALKLWTDATRLAPDVPEYQATMAKLLIALGRPREAETYIDRVRALGRFGQTEALARELETRAQLR